MSGKRRWFQLHLSTIVLMTLAAGVLLGANFFPHRIAINEMEANVFGFPLPMFQDWKQKVGVEPGGTLSRTLQMKSSIQIGSFEFFYEQNGWSYHLLAANVLLCALIVSSFALGVGWLQRKMARK
ncbi:MAG TPA: hypothetical protein VEK08_01615 [Planctomycetota bacterium]|nr:hypothetical protein [Planctomycetota bacterium]